MRLILNIIFGGVIIVCETDRRRGLISENSHHATKNNIRY